MNQNVYKSQFITLYPQYARLFSAVSDTDNSFLFYPLGNPIPLHPIPLPALESFQKPFPILRTYQLSEQKRQISRFVTNIIII